MDGVINGLAMMWVIIAVGVILGRTRVLGDGAEKVLTRIVYYVAAPALVFVTLAVADIRAVLGPKTVAEMAGAIVAALTYTAISVWIFRASRADTVVGAMSSSLSNAAYLGIPMATYVLGDPVHVIPVMLFQLGFLTPLFFVLVDLVSGRADSSVAGTLRTVLTNPILIGAVLGIGCGLARVSVPEIVMQPLAVMGAAAVPCVLIAMGMSLFDRGEDSIAANAKEIVTATLLKLIVQPVVAYLLARFGFGLEGFDLFAVTVMAGLPTAQNSYVAASRAGTGLGIARGAVIVSTIFVTPTLMLIAAALA